MNEETAAPIKNGDWVEFVEDYYNVTGKWRLAKKGDVAGVRYVWSTVKTCDVLLKRNLRPLRDIPLSKLRVVSIGSLRPVPLSR